MRTARPTGARHGARAGEPTEPVTDSGVTAGVTCSAGLHGSTRSCVHHNSVTQSSPALETPRLPFAVPPTGPQAPPSALRLPTLRFPGRPRRGVSGSPEEQSPQEVQM